MSFAVSSQPLNVPSHGYERRTIMNCRGCGVEVDPSEEQVNATIDQILETSLQDAQKKGGVCPLCGHSKEIPYSHRKSVLFGLLAACLLVGIFVAIVIERSGAY